MHAFTGTGGLNSPLIHRHGRTIYDAWYPLKKSPFKSLGPGTLTHDHDLSSPSPRHTSPLPHQSLVRAPHCVKGSAQSRRAPVAHLRPMGVRAKQLFSQPASHALTHSLLTHVLDPLSTHSLLTHVLDPLNTHSLLTHVLDPLSTHSLLTHVLYTATDSTRTLTLTLTLTLTRQLGPRPPPTLPSAAAVVCGAVQDAQRSSQLGLRRSRPDTRLRAGAATPSVPDSLTTHSPPLTHLSVGRRLMARLRTTPTDWPYLLAYLLTLLTRLLASLLAGPTDWPTDWPTDCPYLPSSSGRRSTRI